MKMELLVSLIDPSLLCILDVKVLVFSSQLALTTLSLFESSTDCQI